VPEPLVPDEPPVEEPPELPPEVPALPPTFVVEPVVVAREPVETLAPVVVELPLRLSIDVPVER
jgi:hypothetical protein